MPGREQTVGEREINELMRNRNLLMKEVHILLFAVLAGYAIGIGGVVYLSVDVKIVGALMFTVGLYAICVHGLNLYTGKIGYLPERSADYLIDLLLIWIGNLLGAVLAAAFVLGTRVRGVAETAAAMCKVKAEDGLGSLFWLGVFCGFLMFVAVDGYAKTKNPVILFMGVATFILCGFEHCIADMFYFSVAGMWSPGNVLRILVITFGNSLGGMFIPFIRKLSRAE